MGEILYFPGVTPAPAPAMQLVSQSLHGYRKPFPCDDDGRGGSLSERWQRLCLRENDLSAFEYLRRLNEFTRNPSLECGTFVLERTFGVLGGMAVCLPRVTRRSPVHRLIAFFPRGKIEASQTATMIVRQISDVLPL